ncbi:nitrate transporter, partial [Methylobacterium sp. WL122]
AGRWCADPANRTELAHRLARRPYLNLDPHLIARTFEGTIVLDGPGREREAPDYLRLDAAAQEPRAAHVGWILSQMRAAGQMPAEDLLPAAEAVYRPDLYAAAGLSPA